MPPAAPLRMSTTVRMSDVDADNFILGGVIRGAEGDPWRWTTGEPELRFHVKPGQPYRALMDFTIAGSTFETTGPVTISFFINSQPAGQQVYGKPGDYIFETGAPPSGGELTLKAVISPVWISPTDGAKLGVILKEAGFRPQ